MAGLIATTSKLFSCTSTKFAETESHFKHVVKIQQREMILSDFDQHFGGFMADSQTKVVTKEKKQRVQVTAFQRIQDQLKQAVLRNQLKLEELTALEDYLKKLKGVLA